MNKKDKALVERASREGMMYIVPVKYTGIQKLSKRAFGIQFCNPRAVKDSYVFDLTGSPADIRKGIKYVEKLGIYPTFVSAPIMREGRTYNLFVDEGYWIVSRVTVEDNEEVFVINEVYDYGYYGDEFEFVECEEASEVIIGNKYDRNDF